MRVHRWIAAYLWLGCLCVRATQATNPTSEVAAPKGTPPGHSVLQEPERQLARFVQVVEELLQQGRHEQALDVAEELLKAKLYDQALEAADRAAKAVAAPQQPALLGRAERVRARSLQALGRFQEALQAWDTASRAWRAAGDAVAEVEADLAAALVTFQLGDAAKARARVAQAIQSAQDDEHPKELALALHAGGIQFLALRQPSVARSLFQNSTALLRNSVPGTVLLAEALNDLGVAEERCGELDEAERTHQEALKLREALGAPEAIASCINLGSLLYAKYHLKQAASYLERALTQLGPPEKQPRLGLPLLLNLGRIYASRGDASGADYYFGWADRMPGQNLQQRVACLTGLGLAAFAGHRLERAKTHFLEAGTLLEAAEKQTPALDVRDLQADNYTNLGAVEYARAMGDRHLAGGNQERLRAAQGYFERARSLQEEIVPGTLRLATTLNNLGTVVTELNALDLGETLHRRAWEIRHKLAPESIPEASSLSNLAVVAMRRKDYDTAAELADRAWRIVRGLGTEVVGDEARRSFGSSTESFAQNLIAAELGRKRAVAAFRVLEEGRAQALLDTLMDLRTGALQDGKSPDEAIARDRGSGPGAAARNRQERWRAYLQAAAAHARAEQQMSIAVLAEEAARRQQDLPGADQQARTIWRSAAEELERASRAYTGARIERERKWKAIRELEGAATPLTDPEKTIRHLPEGALHIAYLVSPNYTYLFLLQKTTAGGLSVLAYSLGSTAALERRTDQFVQAVVRHGNCGEAGATLFQALFPPAVRPRVLAAKRLTLAPDGFLWTVPFEALVVEKRRGEPKYLGDGRGMSRTPSLAVLAAIRSTRARLRPGQPPKALIAGNPELGATTIDSNQDIRPDARALLLENVSRDPLTGAGEGAIAAAKLYHTQPLLGDNATEGAVQRQLDAVDVVHLGAHGRAIGRRSQSAAILLALPEGPARAGDEDGCLFAWEISQRPLRADLVVLPVCGSGEGEFVSAEGILGLTRAFQVARARSLVTSLWQPIDIPSAKLTTEFHRLYLQGEHKDAALQKAAALMRRNSLTRHPYYWAAFVLTGDPDNPLNVGKK